MSSTNAEQDALFQQETSSGLRKYWQRALTVLRMARMFWKFTREKPRNTRPQGALPIVAMTREALLAAPNRTLWRLGHSTVLLKLRGKFFLTDPVFSERASPLWFAGPKRFHPAPIAIQDLPPIEAVILSHDHYDHLDKPSIRKLARKTEHFIAPRGVGAILAGWGIDAAKIRELEWGQQTQVAGVRLVSTPTQHFSGRSLWNRNQTLWTSWVFLDPNSNNDGDFRLYFSADSGYFDGFRQIGDQYGPFDVTLVENGAYNVRWPIVHMQPEETIQTHRDLRGKWLVPIHNGTFDLAFHAWTEPMERIQALAARDGIQVATPRFGEAVPLEAMQSGDCWWRGVDPSGVGAPATETNSVADTRVTA